MGAPTKDYQDSFQKQNEKKQNGISCQIFIIKPKAIGGNTCSI